MLATASGLLSIVSLGLTAQLPYLLSRLFHLGDENLSPGVISGIQAIVCGAAIFLPTLFMGGLFPVGLVTAGLAREQAGPSVGRLYAGNTAGAI